MKKEHRYIAFLFLSIALFVTVEVLKPKPVDWSDDFTKQKTIPYATKILNEELEILFPGQEISENSRTLYLFDDIELESRNWVFINNEFVFDRLESDVLLEQVEYGDQVFIAGRIGGFLADTLNLEYDYYYGGFDSTIFQDSMSLGISSPSSSLNGDWKYDADGTFFYFTSYDTSRTTELGSWENTYTNFIRIDIGEGSFYLNSTPYLFTNYYLRDPNKATYAFHALSLLPIQNTTWDSYYKAGKEVAGTPMYVILSTESLKYAWYLSLFSLFLFMIFKARRKQRIIPIIKTPENSTLSFTRTIGMLYLEQNSHKNILEKKVRFFFDYIKTHLRLDTSELNERFKTDLASRSGISKKDINKLFDLIELTEHSKTISDSELKLVTDQIDQFYQNTQR